MNTQTKSPLASHRARMARQGFVRVEVNGPEGRMPDCCAVSPPP